MQPDTTKTVTANVRAALMHKVGQTLTPVEIAKITGEKTSNVSASMYHLEKEKRLRLEKKVGNTNIYLVLPSISKPRPADNRARPNRFSKKRVNGSLTVEKGVPIPKNSQPAKGNKYPFADMAVGDSFKFPAADDKALVSVRRGAGAFRKGKGPKFLVKRISKKSGRCWRIK